MLFDVGAQSTGTRLGSCADGVQGNVEAMHPFRLSASSSGATAQVVSPVLCNAGEAPLLECIVAVSSQCCGCRPPIDGLSLSPNACVFAPDADVGSRRALDCTAVDSHTRYFDGSFYIWSHLCALRCALVSGSQAFKFDLSWRLTVRCTILGVCVATSLPVKPHIYSRQRHDMRCWCPFRSSISCRRSAG